MTVKTYVLLNADAFVGMRYQYKSALGHHEYALSGDGAVVLLSVKEPEDLERAGAQLFQLAETLRRTTEDMS